MALYLQVRPDVPLAEQIQSIKTQLETYLNGDDSAEKVEKAVTQASEAAAQANDAAAASREIVQRADAGEFNGTVLRIDSSRGTTFKNNMISTELTVAIYTGSLRITNIVELRNQYGVSAHLLWYWKRLDEDEFHVIVATDPMLSDDGFTLTISPDDVDTKVTFVCELIV